MFGVSVLKAILSENLPNFRIQENYKVTDQTYKKIKNILVNYNMKLQREK